jgi:uncharacterized membrane protein
MGKGKKKSKKNQEERLPTHLAGVALPQNLREVAAAANQLMRHPVVSDVISAGVLAAIAALAENESVRRAARHAGDEAEEAAEEAARKASRAKVAVKAAAGAMGKRLLDEVKGAAAPKKNEKRAKAKEPAHAD